jgi:hypothetical protein
MVSDRKPQPASLKAPLLGDDEPHYTLKDISKFWNLSKRTAVRLFSQEPGVLAFPGKNGRICTVRVPESVALRVLDRVTIKARPVQSAGSAASSGVLARRSHTREMRAS